MTLTALKHCPGCNQGKPLNAFSRRLRALDKIAYQSYCKECSTGVTRRKRAWIVDAKTGRPCADCGGMFPPVVLDFDHRPGETKLFAVSKGWSTTRERFDAELAKCDIVCSNCHRLRTEARNQFGRKTGGT